MTMFTERTHEAESFEKQMTRRARIIGSYGKDLLSAFMDDECDVTTAEVFSAELLTYAEQVRDAARVIQGLKQRPDEYATTEDIETLEAVLPEWQVQRWLRSRWT